MAESDKAEDIVGGACILDSRAALRYNVFCPYAVIAQLVERFIRNE